MSTSQVGNMQFGKTIKIQKSYENIHPQLCPGPMLITTLKQAASFRGYWPMSMSLLPTFNTLFDVTSLSEVLGCGGGNVVKTKYIIILWWPWFILSQPPDNSAQAQEAKMAKKFGRQF